MLAQNKCSTRDRGYWGALVHPDLSLSRSVPNAFITYACICRHMVGFPCGSVVRNPPAMQETQVRSLGQEDPLEKEMATYCSILP